MPTMAVNDIRMHYDEQGAGAPVMLITGLGGVGSSWGPQIPRFGREFRTIVPDHRGTGRTSVPATGYTIEQHASDMAALLRALTATPAHIVGSSTGGAIGMLMALQHPDTVASLSLVSTWGRTDAYFRRMFEVRKRVLQQLGYEAYVELTLLLLYSPAYLRAHWDAVAEMERQLAASPPDLAAAAARIDMIIAHDALDRLKDVRQPASIVVGDQDVITPPYFSQELKRHLPHAELQMIPGAGHLVQLEAPDLFFEVVRGFIARATRSAKSPLRSSAEGTGDAVPLPATPATASESGP
jgi:aminoacrylate hydrolase